ncbi:RNA polymerase subunit sigma-70 [Streptomyces sp. NPDC059651]|uniref:RNA polymerase subunit sigma-70 n=1 Tax=Streptomyces sp. NPDC059651 TaxID=3346897 RepID=UPI0036C85CE4
MTVQAEDFDRLIGPFRSELLAYCYRMLGSAHDAEDLVQDTYLRAWRAREQYDPTRSSVRTWLYRIATNVCLTALKARGSRPLPSGLVAASEPLARLVPGEGRGWLQPLPDSMVDVGDPAGAVIERSSLRLAFAAALQHLSARQRGALVLRDVLGFSASESAHILGTTVISVNSSLQRARARVKQAGVRQDLLGEPSTAEQRAWVDRYMKAFERADVEGLKRLLTEDVIMEMPPMLNWFTGPGNYGLFMDWSSRRLERNGRWSRSRPTASQDLPPIGASPTGTSCIRSRSSPSPPRASAGIRCSRVPRSSRPSGWRPGSTLRDSRRPDPRPDFLRGRDESGPCRRYVVTSSPEDR